MLALQRNGKFQADVASIPSRGSGKGDCQDESFQRYLNVSIPSRGSGKGDGRDCYVDLRCPSVSIPSRGSGKGDELSPNQLHKGYFNVSIPSRGSSKRDPNYTGPKISLSMVKMFQSPLGEVVNETQHTGSPVAMQVKGFNPLSGKW